MKKESTEDFAALDRRLRADLSPARYRHSVSVARLAERLARRHGGDLRRARLAGLLHDCARDFSAVRLAGEARRKDWLGGFVPGPGRFVLLHAPVSALRARKIYGVRDRAVLAAIERHTLGHRRMGRLDKILYVADYASPDRGFPASAKMRRLALKNLEQAFRETMRQKLLYVLRSGRALHLETVKMYNASAGRKGR